jgi:Tol biopolymer transport system component
MRWEVKVLLAGMLLAVLVAISGCGGNNDQSVFQTVFDRPSWNPQGTRVAFESFGGNDLLYVYSVNNGGGNLLLLTPTDNDDDLTDEGGKMPTWSPIAANDEIVIVARRGTGGQALYRISGSNTAIAPVRLTDDTVVGADSQPSYSPDGLKIVYVSNKNSDHWRIWTVNRDGSGAAPLPNDPTGGLDAQWPSISPDGTKIAFQLGTGGVGVDTAIVTVNADGTNPNPLNLGNGFRDESPAWSPDGTKLAFHSDRSGDFDIYTMNAADGSDIVDLTPDVRSEGFPVWNPLVNKIAFTRDRELWTMNADGSNQIQLTQRF